MTLKLIENLPKFQKINPRLDDVLLRSDKTSSSEWRNPRSRSYLSLI